MTTETVPIIDISAFERGHPAERARIKAGVTDALESVGFMVVTGHGVPARRFADLAAVARQFFTQPIERKRAYISKGQVLNRGYIPPQGETLDAQKRAPDLKEAFVVGRPGADDLRRQDPTSSAYVPNVWPEDWPEFRQALEAYYRDLSVLAGKLLHVFAYTLDLPETYFDADFDRHPSVLRIQNYPPITEAPKPDQIRAAAHKDYGAFTILKEIDLTGGLQVQSKSSQQWIDVRSAPDSFVINIGNVMMRWTNDRWLSNVHRVVNPTDEAIAKASRLSVPFFVHPNPDAIIACLTSCQSETNPARYAPISAAENRMRQLNAGLPTG